MLDFAKLDVVLGSLQNFTNKANLTNDSDQELIRRMNNSEIEFGIYDSHS